MKAAFFKASTALVAWSAPKSLAIAVSFLAALVSQASAQNAGYVFTGLGYAYTPDQKLDATLSESSAGFLGSRTVDADWDDVKSFSAGFGFQGQTTNLRYELGLEHFADFNLLGFDDQRAHYREVYNSTAVLGSAYYDLPIEDSLIRPYFGGGIGVAANSGNGLTISNLLVDSFEDRGVSSGQNSIDLAWHMGLGAAIPLTRKTTLDLGYRYLNLGKAVTDDTYTGKQDSGAGLVSMGGSTDIDSMALTAHQAKIGLRHSLARDENREYRLGDSFQFESSYGLGYGDYDLEWSVSDFDNDPKDKSTMRFEDMDSLTFLGDWQLNYNKLIIDGKARFAWILDGDYRAASEDASASVVQLEGVANDDYIYSGSVGFGYEILTDANTSSALAFRPMVGVGISEQKFRMGDSEYLSGPEAGTEAPLNSTYESRWLSAWLGGEAELVGLDYRFTLRGEFHQASYDAKAQWAHDLTLQQPNSFTHKADKAQGVRLMGRAERDIGNAGRLFMSMEYDSWRAYNGSDTNAPLTSGQSGTLNQVNLDGYSLGAGLVFAL